MYETPIDPRRTEALEGAKERYWSSLNDRQLEIEQDNQD